MIWMESICFEMKTKMKTSISNKPFVALPTDRRTKYLQNRCSFMRGICTKKIGAISHLGAEKIKFPPKRGWHTDICFYRVALLLIREAWTVGYFHVHT